MLQGLNHWGTSSAAGLRWPGFFLESAMSPHPIFHQAQSSSPCEDPFCSKLSGEVVLAQGLDSAVASEPRLPRSALGGEGRRRPNPALSQPAQGPSENHRWAPSSWHSGGPRISVVFPSTRSLQPHIADERMGLCGQNIALPSRVGLDGSSPVPCWLSPGDRM